MVAASNGSKKVIKAILRRMDNAGLSIAAEINKQNVDGNSSIHLAFFYQYQKLAEYLIEKGGDATLKNNQGLIPSETKPPDSAVNLAKDAEKSKEEERLKVEQEQRERQQKIAEGKAVLKLQAVSRGWLSRRAGYTTVLEQELARIEAANAELQRVQEAESAVVAYLSQNKPRLDELSKQADELRQDMELLHREADSACEAHRYAQKRKEQLHDRRGVEKLQRALRDACRERDDTLARTERVKASIDESRSLVSDAESRLNGTQERALACEREISGLQSDIAAQSRAHSWRMQQLRQYASTIAPGRRSHVRTLENTLAKLKMSFREDGRGATPAQSLEKMERSLSSLVEAQRRRLDEVESLKKAATQLRKEWRDDGLSTAFATLEDALKRDENVSQGLPIPQPQPQMVFFPPIGQGVDVFESNPGALGQQAPNGFFGQPGPSGFAGKARPPPWASPDVWGDNLLGVAGAPQYPPFGTAFDNNVPPF